MIDLLRRLRPGRTVALSAALLIVTLLIVHGLTWRSLRQAEDDLASTRATIAERQVDLTVTDEHLGTTEVSLGAMVADLDAAMTALRAVDRDIDIRTTERSDLLARLEVARTQLVSLEQDIDTIGGQLALQASETEALELCLGGVTRALTLVSFNDDSAALASLDRVRGACQSSSALAGGPA